MENLKKENKYDGTPSVYLDHRPFFSIVIACYNSAPYLGSLLKSIKDQNMNDDIEVILSDDCSTESYDDIVSQYDKELCIKRVKTDYNFAPSNTRQKGIEAVTGKWLMFADHDDRFIPNTLRKFKEDIINSQERYYAIADFREYDPHTDKEVHYFSRPMGWCHAKAFNVDNVWKKYNVHFEHDLRSHEDIYICSQLNCIMEALDREPLYVDYPVYIWYVRKDSLSRSKYAEQNHDDVPFFEHFFDDYLHVTAGVYFEKYKEGLISKEYAMYNEVELVAYCYFYMMGFIFHNPERYLKRNLDLCRNQIKETKETFGLSDDDIYNILADNDAQRFMTIQGGASVGAGPYIPCMTLKEFITKYGD